MAKKANEISYWPHMILGFLIVGVTLSYWTVKSASSIPVQESNEFLMKYQQADMNINEILKQKARFDSRYRIGLVDAPMQTIELENAKRAKAENAVVLHKGKNRFAFNVSDHQGVAYGDANVTFLLTRPHTRNDDVVVASVPFKEGAYVVEGIDVQKPGRYIVRLRVDVGEGAVGFFEAPAYLKPE